MQRWLTLNQICEVLGTNTVHVAWLVKQGYLEFLPGGHKGGARYLDPTPEYAERLRLCEMIYQRRVPLPDDFKDISPTALLTLREVAEICGWSLVYARRYAYDKKIPRIRVNPQLYLYSVESVRKLLWDRKGRSLSSKRSPVLLSELIDYFMKHQASAAEGLPTDAEFADDDRLQKKLEAMLRLKSPHRERAIIDFQEKVSLAKTVTATLG